MTIYTVKLGPGALHALNLGEHLLSRGYGGSENIRIRIQLAALDEPSDAVHVANANEPGVYELRAGPIHESECVTDRGPMRLDLHSREAREALDRLAGIDRTARRPELRAVPLDEARAALGGIMGGECLSPMGEALQAADEARGEHDEGGRLTPHGALERRAAELEELARGAAREAEAARLTAKQYRDAADMLRQSRAQRQTADKWARQFCKDDPDPAA